MNKKDIQRIIKGEVVKILAEGTWAVPNTQENYDIIESACQSLIDEEIDIDEFKSLIHNSLGDDSLYDDIDQAIRYQEKTGDIQNYAILIFVKNTIRDFAQQYDRSPDSFNVPVNSNELWDLYEKINSIANSKD